jgi:hypothetical protein
MAQFAQLLQAIAAILWPLFAFAALFTFRPQISQLLRRIKRGKLLGQEIELEESLTLLQSSAVKVEREVAALPVQPAEQAAHKIVAATETVIERIVGEAVYSPKVALIMLAAELEKEARHKLAETGLLKGRQYLQLTTALAELDKQFGGLPRHVSDAIKLFWNVRSRLIHGAPASDEDVVRAVDSGLTILKALQALPRQMNIVYHPGVDLFSDAQGRNPMSGVKGVMIQTVHTDGARHLLVFPTTKTHFKKGKPVAWEWGELKWGPSWYRDPDTHEIKQANGGAMEFVGRHLEDI